MTVPFGPLPGDPDARALDALLDTMLAGRRPQSAALIASDEAVSLAECTRLLACMLNRPESGENAYLDTDPSELRWEEVLGTAYPSTPHQVTPPPQSPEAFRHVHSHRAWAGSKRPRLAIPAIALLLLLVASFTGGWWLGQRGSGGDGASVVTAAGDEITPFSTAYSSPHQDASSSLPATCGAPNLACGQAPLLFLISDVALDGGTNAQLTGYVTGTLV